MDWVAIAHHRSHIKFGDMQTSVGNAHPTHPHFVVALTVFSSAIERAP
jgi:hypothetical protein